MKTMHLYVNGTWGRRVLFLAVLLVVMLFIEQKLTIVFTESINATLLWRTAERPDKGDYANYTVGTEHTQGRHLVVTKKVTCVEGETLELKGRDFFCNGVWLGTAKEKSRKGEPLEPFTWNGEVPAGKVFIMGEHKDSWDSRYWGFATLTETEKVVKII